MFGALSAKAQLAEGRGQGEGWNVAQGTPWAAASSRCVGWEQGLELEVAEIGLDLVLGGRRELL